MPARNGDRPGVWVCPLILKNPGTDPCGVSPHESRAGRISGHSRRAAPRLAGRSGRQVGIPSRGDAGRDRRRGNADHRFSRRRRHERDRGRVSRAWCSHRQTIGDRGHRARGGIARSARAGAGAGSRQLGHLHAAARGDPVRPELRFPADRRCIAVETAHAARHRAARRHGRAHRVHRGRHVADADSRRVETPRDRLRPAGCERAAQVRAAARRSLCRGPHLRDRAGRDAGSHRADAGVVWLSGRTRRAPRLHREPGVAGPGLRCRPGPCMCQGTFPRPLFSWWRGASCRVRT